MQDICEHIVTCAGTIKGFKGPCLSLLGELCTSHLSLLSKELPLFLLGQALTMEGNHQPMVGNHQLLPCHGVGGGHLEGGHLETLEGLWGVLPSLVRGIWGGSLG